jgi:hypothetical protein
MQIALGDSNSKMAGQQQTKMAGQHQSKMPGKQQSKPAGPHQSKMAGQHQSKMAGQQQSQRVKSSQVGLFPLKERLAEVPAGTNRVASILKRNLQLTPQTIVY